jgi:hypothetical protein
MDLRTGLSRRLTELDERGAIQGFDIAPDGKSIVFARVQQNSDVVLIQLTSTKLP